MLWGYTNVWNIIPSFMYGEILRVPNNRVIYEEYSSPFENDQDSFIATDVTTKYSNRGVENTRLIQEHTQYT